MTKKLTFLFLAMIMVSGIAFCQDLLDTEKYKVAELFVVKKGYDVQQRLKEIKLVEGRKVTVFVVSGKDNKIKQTYTGIAEMADSKFTDKEKSTLIIVKVMEDGVLKAAYFPLTNSNKYRIYLTERMN